MYHDEETGLGIAPAIIGAGVNLVSGLFGGGPSKEQLPGGAEYEFRKRTVEVADQLARSGVRRDAWNILGSIGRVAPIPADQPAITELPIRGVKTSTGGPEGTYGVPLKKGHMTAKWGDSFAPIQQFAAQEWGTLKPLYASPSSTPVGAATAPPPPVSPTPVVAMAGLADPKQLAMLAVGGVVLFALSQAGRR
jgi:hypothetical protein